jgi:hypothetical protein
MCLLSSTSVLCSSDLLPLELHDDELPFVLCVLQLVGLFGGTVTAVQMLNAFLQREQTPHNCGYLLFLHSSFACFRDDINQAFASSICQRLVSGVNVGPILQGLAMHLQYD